MLVVSEIFSSVQGEGWRQGIPAIFIRLYGCNLKCDFCDTPQAFSKKQLICEESIVERVKKLSKKDGKISSIIITGGEPYLQDFGDLVMLLKKHGFFVTVETNGTIWKDINVDWICVSPKRQAIKMFDHGYHKKFKMIANEFKYVITGKSDIDFIDKSITQPVILQPVDNDLKIALMLAEEIKKYGMPNWFIRFQLHKIMGIK
ncbi:MAG: 7-carboxy-7-deazaguanine synthase QueE [Candidatus Omnitrophica bacterium]|jgi:organic radical activating enzyme|nr:7-carboxy-7-deazaguanine synthase QueE [Candidatus Omnitrophota bacterium]